MDLSSKSVVMVVASKNFRDEEFLESRKIFEASKIKVIVASSKLTASTGYFGAVAKPNILVENINVDEFDAIVFIGGSGAEEYFDNLDALKVAQDCIKKNKILAAICIAPSIFANAGILKGKKVTAFQSEKNNLTAKGAIWTGKDVEVDGKIITSDGPKSASKFGNTICELLSR